MLTIIFLASLTVTVMAADYPVTDQCPYECRCSGERIYCHNYGWTIMPSLMSPVSNFTGLEIFANRIGSIPGGRFPLGLVYIDFSANRIENISSDAFDAISDTLETIYFSDARFTEMPDAFSNLMALKLLSIELTPVSVFDSAIMSSLGSTLETLILRKIDLNSWPTWLQNDFANLETLTLADFPITTIPDNGFDSMKDSLRVLTLDNVGLSQVPTALSDMTNLEVLNLQGNNIQFLSGFPQLSNLISINVANNMISDATSLSIDLSSYEGTLCYIDLSENNLTQIPDFSNFSLLFTVNLIGNRISDHTSGGFSDFVSYLTFRWNELPYVPTIIETMQGLTWLDLSQNSIKEFNFSTIAPSLLILDIGSNQITELLSDSSQQNMSLKFLKFYYNPIDFISPSAFTSLTSLTYIDLGGTKLTRVPMALSSLTALDELYMTPARDLLCTCEEAGLLNWFASRFSMDVHGTCGDFRIDDFFIMFGPQCPKLG